MILPEPLEFQWDKGNTNKNLVKHGVSNEEIERVFFGSDKIIFRDLNHSLCEDRCIVIGKTMQERWLYIVFTVRSNKVRIISARDTNRKEKFIYEKNS